MPTRAVRVSILWRFGGGNADPGYLGLYHGPNFRMGSGRRQKSESMKPDRERSASDGDACSRSGISQLCVQCCECCTLTDRQFQVGGVVSRKIMFAGQRQNGLDAVSQGLRFQRASSNPRKRWISACRKRLRRSPTRSPLATSAAHIAGTVAVWASIAASTRSA
jgi:hypothetical protein